jgi:DNA-binding NarL/FixJ family response regulator
MIKRASPISGPENNVNGKDTKGLLREMIRDLRERDHQLNCLHEISTLQDMPDLSMEQSFRRVVECIFSARRYSAIAGVSITVEDRSYKSPRFIETEWRQAADITVSGKIAGIIEIYYLENTIQDDGNTPAEGKRNFIDIIAHELGRFIERRRTRQELAVANEKLMAEQIAMQKKHTALKEVLNQIDEEKKHVMRDIQSNIERIARPILRMIEEKISPRENRYVTLLDSCLDDISSPFISRLEMNNNKLTPREVEICHMIRNGFSSKAIAATLNISLQTVHKQRKQIRAKLDLTNKKINLTSYLKKE